MNDILNNIEVKHQLFLLLDVVIAAVLTGIVGYERESADKPAGFRTNMIIGASATLLIGLGHQLAESFHDIEGIQVDPTRIIEAIIVGVSFIGAGTIIKNSNNSEVSNLTTAATIILSAGIGIAVALHFYVFAVGVTVLTLIINQVLKRLKN